MLQYRGTRQAPRKYLVPEHTVSASSTSLCSSCRSCVWTSSLYSNLRTVISDEKQFVTSYQASASDLRFSVLHGCKWCKTLADGIHGRVFLDSVYEQWNKTDSWPSSASDGKEENQNDEEDGWNDASVFNTEVDSDPAGGWNSDEDRDTLAFDCVFSVDISFERGEGSLFTFLNAHIESVDDDEENAVRKVRGEKAVDLRYYINMIGQYQMRKIDHC